MKEKVRKEKTEKIFRSEKKQNAATGLLSAIITGKAEIVLELRFITLVSRVRTAFGRGKKNLPPPIGAYYMYA